MAASPSKTFPPPFSMSSYYFSLYSFILDHHHHQTTMIFISLCFFFISTLIFSLSIIIFSFKHNSKKQNYHHGTEKQETQKPITDSSVDNENDSKKTDIPQTSSGSDPTRLSHLLLLELLKNEQKGSNFDGVPAVEEEEEKKKRKKRGKKKRPDPDIVCGAGEESKEELVCLYPFTKSTSATQRKIKQQYDQLVKSHESNGLTLSQVGQFVNCLVESKKELQHRSEVIQRKFTITKALLLKADRSSFDRLRQQIYKIELEQKRLEEDGFVYNWLQQQLKLSPAYKKMLEIGACMEMKAKSCEQTESIENEVDDISFEELLAQEKKDAFWQRNGKLKSCS